MKKIEMTEEIMAAKKHLGIGWEELAEKVSLNPVFLTSVCLGMNTLSKEAANKLSEVLELPQEIAEALQEYPTKTWHFSVPQDPLVYRFYEVVGVYGETMKEIINEKFGNGIMSAIDFSLDIQKEENPLGDRVVVTMNGKFLPYKSW
ncbi:MAG TPA: cyanase [Sulfurovum sp.]|jgi:cyanate lyase|nr:MAG: cyanase [Sulfurovum sp. 35-42-20]OYY55776.1 MAG: cyanase [Sulfurovum sp. 28-43-6]OYZ25577.1 MAG: cyanase [Sulfurovum sp. 16-42-52]OYZ49588.1 MAG: cyanase [Sulfurovum sp. 24-42-9]OZA45565.1 MAG: cyanase [Sulfurovum sp. 17-42-90]OZA59607.1 MAG: cyanase [Sulfurovum sp. 39-42-12]HQR74659.1 cyanase [Sulfurovum sp.]